MKTPKNKLRVLRAAPLATGLLTSLVALFVTALATLPGTALALAPSLSLGMSDTFQAGVQGWTSGDANPSPPVIGAGAGPAGAADRYLQLSASGVQGPGGKLVAIAGPQWAGDYIAAGVDAITLDGFNFGSTDLSLRLMFIGASGITAITSAAVLLPAGSGWQPLRFALGPSALAGAGLAALSGVMQLRLFHGVDAIYPGANVVTVLGIDNVRAVPEPRAALLFGAGAVALCLRRRLRRCVRRSVRRSV